MNQHTSNTSFYKWMMARLKIKLMINVCWFSVNKNIINVHQQGSKQVNLPSQIVKNALLFHLRGRSDRWMPIIYKVYSKQL